MELPSTVCRRYRGDMIGVYKFVWWIYTSGRSLLSRAPLPKSAERSWIQTDKKAASLAFAPGSRQETTATPHQSVFYRPDGLLDAQAALKAQLVSDDRDTNACVTTWSGQGYEKEFGKSGYRWTRERKAGEILCTSFMDGLLGVPDHSVA